MIIRYVRYVDGRKFECVLYFVIFKKEEIQKNAANI